MLISFPATEEAHHKHICNDDIIDISLTNADMYITNEQKKTTQDCASEQKIVLQRLCYKIELLNF